MADPRTGAMLDWTTEEEYWRNNYPARPYVGTNRNFDYWQPGYRYGYESANRYPGRKWDEVEGDLRSGWEKFEHRSKSTWEEIRAAVRDGWDRVTGNR